MTVAADFAGWLKASGLQVIAASPGAGAWGEIALDRTVTSPLATLEGAAAEAARQAGLYGVPIAVDEHDVPGRRVDLLCQCIRIEGDELGYGAGLNAVVVEAQERAGMTTLVVIVRLA